MRSVDTHIFAIWDWKSFFVCFLCRRVAPCWFSLLRTEWMTRVTSRRTNDVRSTNRSHLQLKASIKQRKEMSQINQLNLYFNRNLIHSCEHAARVKEVKWYPRTNVPRTRQVPSFSFIFGMWIWSTMAMRHDRVRNKYDLVSIVACGKCADGSRLQFSFTFEFFLCGS